MEPSQAYTVILAIKPDLIHHFLAGAAVAGLGFAWHKWAWWAAYAAAAGKELWDFFAPAGEVSVVDFIATAAGASAVISVQVVALALYRIANRYPKPTARR